MNLYARFTDDTKSHIESLFSSPQPNIDGVEEIKISDARYKAFIENTYDPYNLLRDLTGTVKP